MNIVYYTSTDFLDSDMPLIREYQQMGHRVKVFIPLAPFNIKGSVVNIKELKPVDDIVKATEYSEILVYKDFIDLNDIYFVNRSTSSVRTMAYFRTMKKMCKMIADFNPDAIHCTFPLDTLDWLLIRFRKKLVLTMHDPFQHSSKGGLRTNLFRWLSVKLVPKIVLLNSVQKQDFQRVNHVSSKRILINRLGVYTASRTFVKDDAENDCNTLLFFGKISPYKGIEYLCEAMVDVHREYPQAKLIIAGGGKIPFDYTPYEGLDYIELRNRFIPTPEIAELLGKVGFTVCPYRDATQSGVIMTAFALDCPIVASNVGALSEQIEDEKTGLLVPPCDSKALASAIKRMLGNPGLQHQMRENIRLRNTNSENSWSNIAAKYIEFYNKKLH